MNRIRVQHIRDLLRRSFHLSTIAACATALWSVSVAENIVFPSNASIKNVRTRFGAKGDGTTDDTQPLQTAFLEGGGIIYLPNGTYRVTAPIKCRSTPGAGPWIYGQSRNGVVIKLDNNAAGFGNAGSPQAVLAAHGIAPGGAISADIFFRQWHNFTVDAGTNAGAIGIRYYSNNSGVLDNVLIKGNGVYGLDMGWINMNGPCLIQNVTVEGFNVGVYTNNGINSQTMVGVTVRNSRTIGVSASGQNFSVEDLVVENVPVAVEANCMLVVVNGTFKGSDASKPAVSLKGGYAYLRNITTQGFSRAIESSTPGGSVGAANAAEYVSHPIVAGFTDFRRSSLMLPLKKSPPLQWEEDTSKWVNVQDFGALPADRFEDSQGIQKAIDAAAAAGKTTVYFPVGAYTIAANVFVHGSVRHLIGFGESDVVLSFTLNDLGFVLRDNAAPVVRFENFMKAGGLTITSNNTSAVVIDHSVGIRAVAAGTGDIFINNCVGSMVITNRAGHVWARQWNTEGRSVDTDNAGGFLYVLGLKTENGWIKIRTTNGGRSELLGAHIYNLCNGTGDNVLFPVVNSFATFACVRETRFCGTPYQQHVRETRGTETKTYTNGVWGLFSAAPSSFDPTSVRLSPAPGIDAGDLRSSTNSARLSPEAVVYDCRGARAMKIGSRIAAGIYIVRTPTGIRRAVARGR